MGNRYISLILVCLFLVAQLALIACQSKDQSESQVADIFVIHPFHERTAEIDGSLGFAEFSKCGLISGDILENCRVGYRLLGKPSDDFSNIVVVPTWYRGTSQDLIKYGYVGSGKMIDTNKYFVVLIDALGNGISSSPSNASSGSAEIFPNITIKDMVHVQQRFLNDFMGIKRAHAVVGLSMGAHQTYEWMMLYPHFASKYVPIEGAPWRTIYDELVLKAWFRLLDMDLSTDENIDNIIEIIVAIDALTSWTPGYVVREFSDEDFKHWFKKLRGSKDRRYLLDRKSQTEALMNHDIRENGSLTDNQIKTLKSLDILSITFKSDLKVNPRPNLDLSNAIGFPVLNYEGDCGHMGPELDCYQTKISKAVDRFLDN